MNRERVLWFVILAVVLWAGGTQYQASKFDRGIAMTPTDCGHLSGNPILDMELSRSAACFTEIIGQGDLSTNLKVARTNTRLDFLFIALYSAMFVLFAILYKNRWSVLLGLCIGLTAVLDLIENSRILNGLSNLETLAADWITPRQFSVWKWIAFGILLLWTAFLVKSTNRFLTAMLVLAAISTALGLGFAPLMSIAAIFLSLALIVALLQYFPFDIRLSWVQYAYLMRFQILFGVLLGVVLPAGYFFAPGIFLGLFDTRGLWSFTLVVWASLQLAWAIMVTSRLVLAYGRERFPDVTPTNIKPMNLRAVFLFGLLAAPCIAIASLGTLDVPGWRIFVGILGGSCMAVTILILTAMLHFAIEFPATNTAEVVFPTFGVIKASPGKSPNIRIRSSERAPSTEQGHRSLFQRPLDAIGRLLPPELRSGIWDAKGNIRSGHELAVAAVTILLVLYVALGIVLFPTLRKPEHQPAALFYLLFLFTLLTWTLSGAAFFLDRLRLPVFTSLIAFSFLTGVVSTDHEFSISPIGEQGATVLSPERVVEAWATGPRKGKTITIVSTAGGGIRASAWTAEILTRLQEHCGPKFNSSLLLISSVSGGSVGSMAFLSQYQSRTGELLDDSLSRIQSRASRSSLSGVGWGFLYPDFLRTVPLVGALVPQTFDRGWALENSWMSGAEAFPNLSQWRKDVASGTRPAAIFNATAAESGERFVIASTDTDPTGTVVFSARFPDWDIPIATAARLSATFPYVTPMARASSGSDGNRFHVADGGYYDNSGVLSAVAWIREARKEVRNYRLLFISIDSEPGPEHKGRLWSWQRQIMSPIETLKNVRTSSQEFRDKLELDISLESLKQENLKASVAKFIFRSPPQNDNGMMTGGKRVFLSRRLGVDVDAPPLSWHLNQLQRESIHRAWGDPRLDSDRSTVYSELGCPATTR